MKKPPVFTRGRRSWPAYFIRVTPQLKALEISRLREWEARRNQRGRHHDSL